MKHRVSPNTLLSILALAILPLSTACKTTGADKSQDTAASITKLEASLQAASNQVQTTLDALNKLVSEPQGDLRPAFDAYAKEVSGLESAAATVSKDNANVRAKASAYYTDWETNQATIQNPDLKKKSEERRSAMMAKQDEANAWAQKFGKRFDAFVVNLTDIQNYVVSDLNAAGVESVADSAATATQDGAGIRADLEKLVASLAEVRKAPASTGAAAPPAE